MYIAIYIRIGVHKLYSNINNNNKIIHIFNDKLSKYVNGYLY